MFLNRIISEGIIRRRKYSLKFYFLLYKIDFIVFKKKYNQQSCFVIIFGHEYSKSLKSYEKNNEFINKKQKKKKN